MYKFVEHPQLDRLFFQMEPPSFEDKVKLQFWIIGQMRAREHEWLQPAWKIGGDRPVCTLKQTFSYYCSEPLLMTQSGHAPTVPSEQ